MRLLTITGGGWKGAWSAMLARKLWQDNRYDGVAGVSVGSLNGMLGPCLEQWDTLFQLWDSCDTRNPIFGIKGFLRPRYHAAPFRKDIDGAFDLAPLAKLCDQYVDPKDMRRPLCVGYVDRKAGVYCEQIIDTDTPKSLARDLLLASSAQSGIMCSIPLPGGAIGVDGGHRHVSPVCLKWRDQATHIHALYHQRPEDVGKDRERRRGIMPAIGWTLGYQFDMTAKEDFEDLRELAMTGVHVEFYQPSEDLGSMLDASRSSIQRRYKLGIDSYWRPQILPGGDP